MKRVKISDYEILTTVGMGMLCERFRNIWSSSFNSS